MAQTQAVAIGAAASTTAPVNISASSSGGSLVYAIWLSSATAPTALADSAGGSLAGAQWTLRQSTGAWFIYDRIGAPAGITSVTATFGSTAYLAICIERDDLVSFDKTAYTEVGLSTAPSSGSVAATAFANEVALGFFATFTAASNSYVQGAGWTALTGTGLTSGKWSGTSGDEAFAESQILVATGTPAATATCANSYNYAAIVTYRQSVAGGGAAKQGKLSLGIGVGL